MQMTEEQFKVFRKYIRDQATVLMMEVELNKGGRRHDPMSELMSEIKDAINKKTTDLFKTAFVIDYQSKEQTNDHQS